VVYEEILLPDIAPLAYADRNTLWNAVERSERRKDSQTAREINLALPRELDRTVQIELLKYYVWYSFVHAGMIADISVHDTGEGNPHAHVMLSTRHVNKKGFGEKNRQWNTKDMIEKWRKEWAREANAALARNGYAERIDHRSYKRQGLDRVPMQHLGVSAHHMEVKGVKTLRGENNRVVEQINGVLDRARMAAMKPRKLVEMIERRASSVTAEQLAVRAEEIAALERRVANQERLEAERRAREEAEEAARQETERRAKEREERSQEAEQARNQRIAALEEAQRCLGVGIGLMEQLHQIDLEKKMLEMRQQALQWTIALPFMKPIRIIPFWRVAEYEGITRSIDDLEDKIEKTIEKLMEDIGGIVDVDTVHNVRQLEAERESLLKKLEEEKKQQQQLFTNRTENLHRILRMAMDPTLQGGMERHFMDAKQRTLSLSYRDVRPEAEKKKETEKKSGREPIIPMG
jgi:hypothetical protein